MKRHISQTTLAMIFLTILYVGLVPVARAQDEGGCSNASLRGSFGFERQGFNPAVGHVGGIGVFAFDGNGNLSGLETNVTETTGVSRKTFTGAYNVNPDCTGSAVEGSTTVDFVIVSENEVFVISTNQDPAGAQRVVTWVFKKQFPQEED